MRYWTHSRVYVVLLGCMCLSSISLSYSLSSSHRFSPNQVDSLERRSAFKCILGVTLGISSLGSNPSSSWAAENTAEAIRQTMSNVPGYGPSDIFYPECFEGKWKVKRTMYNEGGSNETPNVSDYEVRFIRKENGIVADRGFNEASRIASSTNDGKLVRETIWDVTNPNVLTLLFKDGTSKEIRITKRSSEVSGNPSSLDDWLMQSSEFARVSEVGQSGIPDLSITHTLAKWKPGVNKDVIEGIELAFNEGNLGDPMAFSSQPIGTGKTKIKSRIRMERI